MRNLTQDDILSICKSKKSTHTPRPVRVSRLVYLKRQEPVYNLSVAGKPEYYANGILVHNCYARVGLSRLLGSTGGFLVEPEPQYKPKVTDMARNGEVVLETLMQSVSDTLADLE